VVGFFSKEKLSWDSNNLACICVFPPWQKRGFGQILMAVSYELSKEDGRLGGPEKPLSELGSRAYIHFWSATIARRIMEQDTKDIVTVKSISEATYILPEDVIATLKDMDIVERRAKGKTDAVINKAAIVKWMAKNRVDMVGPVDQRFFINQPPEDEND
jgi:MOZ/SAS family